MITDKQIPLNIISDRPASGLLLPSSWKCRRRAGEKQEQNRRKTEGK